MWLQFALTALVIVVAGVRLTRYADIIGEKSRLGRNWVGVLLLAATTSLPELFTGFGATALRPLPDIAVGDVLGSCLFNLLILSMMDLGQRESTSAYADKGHALSIGFGLLLIGVAGTGMVAGDRVPTLGWIGVYTPVLIGVYFLAMRVIYTTDRHRHAGESRETSRDGRYRETTLRAAILHYSVAAVVVIAAALRLPVLGAALARQTGLGEAFVGSLFVALTTSLPEVVVSVTSARIGAMDLGISNILGSNLFNLFILGLDDVFYREGPLLGASAASHGITIMAIVMMNGLFLIGLTRSPRRKRFIATWEAGAMATVYVLAIALSYLLGDR